MKNILILIAIFLASNIYAQKYVLLEINSEWNLRNSAKIDKVNNVEYRIAYLEEQTPAFRNKIKSVPIAILYKDNNKIAQWAADISFKLIITKDQINKAIKESNGKSKN